MNLAMLATQLSTRLSRTAGAPDSTPPTAQIVGVSPTPRNSDVAAITVIFSEPVTGLNASKFTLKLDGGSNLLTGSEPVVSNDGGRTWTIGNLSFLTEDEGTYVLQLVGSGSGVRDLSGNELSGTVSTTWDVDLTYPTASITAVSPDPIDVPVNLIEVVFSEPVSGVSIDRFTLKRDGGANLLTDAQFITTSDFTTYTIHNLALLTGVDGSYTLSLITSSTVIFDAAGNGLLGTASETWVADTASPPTVAITAVSPDPRSDGVDEIEIVFSEEVVGFNIGQLTLTLTRDGSPVGGNLLTGSQTVTTGDDITFTLGNLESITRGRGEYVLTVLPGIVQSLATEKVLQVGDTEGWSAIVLPWAPTVNTFRTSHAYHGLALQNDTVFGGLLSGLSVTSAGQNGTEYELTLTIPSDQDFRDGDKVVVEGSSAGGANGYFSIVRTASNKIKLVGSTYAGNGSGGKCYRWVAGRFDQLGMFAIVANQMRGLETSINLAGGGMLTPYGVHGNLYCVTGAAEVSGSVRLTVTGHPFSTGNVVEVAGVRISQSNAEVFHGCWTVTVNDANTITLDGAKWPRTSLPAGTAAVYSPSTGIVRLHTIAKLQRTYLVSGGVDNPSAVAIASQAAADDQVFSYKQASQLLRAWMREHLDEDMPHYFSTSVIGTPEEVLNRGSQGSYPMPMVNLDETYFNGWGIASSDSNGGLCRLTLTKAPMADWDHGAVRAVVLNHSNPSYGLDRYIDHDALNARDGIAAFDRIIGVSGTALGGSTTTLNKDTQFNPAVVLGAQCHFLTGANAGLTRTIRSVANGNLTIEFDTALPFTVDNQHNYRITCHGYDISSVTPAANQITLDVPYRAVAGTGGAVLLFGDNTGITQGDSRPGGGSYARLTTVVSHGFAVGDYVLLCGMTGAGSASYNCNGSLLANPTDRITITKVVSVKGSKVVDLEVAYAGAASGGQWFATCQFLCTTVFGARVGLRIDQPDYRRADVLAKFNTDLKSHLDTIYARDGASHIGVFDECSLRHASSASQTIRVFGSLNGETSAETIARVGEVIQHLKDAWCRTGSVNTTTWLTKDSLSTTDRAALIASWGGFISESACMQFDRSVYQMLDGWIAHITAMLDAGLVYDYQVQAAGIAKVDFQSARTSADGTGRLELVFASTSDPGTYPTAGETTQAALGNPHNHSGHVVGVHIAGGSTINGVHRIWKRSLEAGTNRHILTMETRFPGGSFSSGFIVRPTVCPPMKVSSIADNGSGKVRVTTEFPHYMPDADDAAVYMTLYGWAGSAGQPVDGTAYAATKVGANTFDLLTLNSGAGTSGGGIAVWGDGGLTADQAHALGVFWMLWDGLRAMRINLPLPSSISPWVTYVPSGLSADGAYSHDTFAGTADSGSTTTMTDAGSAFTDAVLGEQILFTSGPNANLWRRITAVNSATQITFDAFPNAVASGHAFTIGKTTTGDVDKVLQLSRSFNSAARRIEVYPQKSLVKYVGTWN